MKGTVYLIGAGPGDPGLLTLRGKEILEKADVVVYDRLVSPAILGMCNPKAKMVDVGKMPTHHKVKQSEINRLLVQFACEFPGGVIARLKGGDPYLRKCESIVSQMQSSENQGWKAFDSNRNRYALINNLMDEAFKKYREFYYTYHRLALDNMAANVANARALIAKDIPVLREANRARPATYVINTFLDAKSDELVNIFMKGTDKEKKEVYEILMDVDPTRSNQYDKIVQ